ncbi:MAG TPA: potassium channel protein [Sandaracinaceae bacterium LLY-WYZ-13_1]|nr:potassium channel protein [Sandaracinaceae bacterium LLY-WYZ-13_1]
MARPDDQREIFRGRLILASLLLGLVVLVGSGGYHLLGDGRWTLEEVFYFTVITLSTVGFGETLPGMHDVPYARLWTIVMIFSGSGTLLYFVSTLTAFIVEGDIQGAIRRNRMQKRIDHLQGHFIVCGVGSTGIHVVEELINTQSPFVVVDRDEERLMNLTDKLGPQRFLYVLGDATDDETLVQAGISRADGVIAALTDDKDNLYITLTAFQLERERAQRGNFRIVAKAVDPSARAKLFAAGATRVVSPSEIGGMRMVSEMVRPAVVEFLDLMLRDPEKNLRIEEVEIPVGSSLVGARLRDTTIRARTKAMVIAVKHGGETPRYTYNPGPDLVLEEGMILIVLAETSEMNKLRDGIASGMIGRV